jgi:hypothetical protein
MNPPAMLDYVVAAAAVLRLPLDAARAQRVSEILMRTAAIASSLDAVTLAPEHELAEIFRPAPFPAVDPVIVPAFDLAVDQAVHPAAHPTVDSAIVKGTRT